MSDSRKRRQSRCVVASVLLCGATTAPALAELPYGADPLLDQSSYALGSVTLNVVFTQPARRPDRATKLLGSQQRELIKSEIADGVAFWESLTESYHPNAQLKFTVNYVNDGKPLKAKTDPINHTVATEGLWINDVMDRMGFSSNKHTENVRLLNHASRAANNTNWAYTLFVVEDIHNGDHQFSDGRFAYTQPAGSYIVMTQNLEQFGLSAFDRIFAHETGHIFGAMDEYAASRESNTIESGYLRGVNGNAELSDRGQFVAPPEGRDTLMNNNTLRPSSFSMKQWGHVDTDGDSIPDILDMAPVLTGELIPEDDNFRFVGKTKVTALANLSNAGSKNPITINTIDRALYNLDGQGWVEMASVDDNFDDDWEELMLSLTGLSNGEHSLKIQTFNSVDIGSNVLVFNFTTISGSAVPIPLPAAVWSGTFTLGGLGIASFLRRRSHRQSF